MIFWLLLITGYQLWCPVLSPKSRGAVYHLAQGKPETGIRNKVNNKHTDYRRRAKVPKIAPIQRLIRVSAPTSTTTGFYWNLTLERCDYMRFRCSRSSTTGEVCARTLYYQYYTFENYCAMEYHNCLTRYDKVWSIAYMGACKDLEIDPDLYVYMTYDQMANNSKLTQMYAVDSGEMSNVGEYASTASPTSSSATTEFIFDFNTTDVIDSSTTDTTDKDSIKTDTTDKDSIKTETTDKVSIKTETTDKDSKITETVDGSNNAATTQAE